MEPEIPGELWMLWNEPADRRFDAGWVASIDDAPHGQTYLVAFSESEAAMASAHQNREFCINCRPVRVK